MFSQPAPGRKVAIKADLWLLFLTLIWGSTFPLVKTALLDISPYLLLGVRFWIASLALWIVFRHKLKNVPRRPMINGMVLGIVLWIGFAFQTVGLKLTTASKSGFLTGTLVVMVPLIVMAIERRIPRPSALLGVVFAFIGIYLMTDPRGGDFNLGDILTVFCALSFAIQVILLQAFTKKDSFIHVGFYQVLTTAVLSIPTTFLLERPWVRITTNLTIAVVVTSLLATALGLMIQAGKQKETTAVNAAIIYTGEPIFAAIFSFIFIGEMFTTNGFIGAGLILAGMLIAEFRRNAANKQAIDT